MEGRDFLWIYCRNGCALVGVFPMNNETIIGHGIAAMAFFMGSML
jgi:hypothetical protein